MPVLETHSLSVSIGDANVCSDLHLRINPGESWCMLGRNGVGKTTLLHTLAGLRPADGGTINLNGTALASRPGKAIARELGILFQEHQDTFPADVMETVLAGRHPWLGPLQWESDTDRSIAMTALRDVGLEKLASRNVATLSGGERRRAGIATLLTQAPQLMLLDEPTNHLDIHHQVGTLELLKRQSAHNGTTLLYVMHDINLALRYCDHFLLLYGNGAHESGTAEAVINRENLERLYNHPLHHLQDADGQAWLPG